MNANKCPTCGSSLTEKESKRLKMLGTNVDKMDLLLRIEELRETLYTLNQRVTEEAARLDGRIDNEGSPRIGG